MFQHTGWNMEQATSKQKPFPGLGARIRDLRKGLNLKQRELAERVGVNHLAVWTWEHEESTPKAEHFAKLAEALSTDVASLLAAERANDSDPAPEAG